MIIRSMSGHAEKIFLTFDDGPDAVGTPAVLDVLARKKVQATFFLVAGKIRDHRKLVGRMIVDGHGIGNHSLDHLFRNFFTNDEHLRSWLAKAGREFASAGIHELVGFRPPAGIITPGLKRVLKELNIPMLLWNERFFDAVVPWGKTRALRSAAKIQGGSIVLLHDRQPAARIANFCETLEVYIDALRARGFEFDRLPVWVQKSSASENSLTNSLPLYSTSTSQTETVPT